MNESAAEEAARRRRIRLDNSDLVKTDFWVAQMFMLAATVIGVYLAAQAGLKQAVEFDTIINKQDNYHLQRSLYDELGDNLNRIQAYAEFLQGTPPYDLKPHNPQLQDYVWQTMRFSPQTLETPAHILSATRRFYSDVEYLIIQAENRRMGAAFVGEQLAEKAQQIEKDTLPALQQSISQLRRSLAADDVNVR